MKKRIRPIFLNQKLTTRAVAMLMTFCMAFTTFCSHGAVFARADGTAGIVNLTEFSVTIDGKDPSECGPLENGQELFIKFKWNLDNSDMSKTRFEAPIEPIENIKLLEYPEAPLSAPGYGVVGKYTITGDKFIIELNYNDGAQGESFFKSDDRAGWGEIYGTINVTDDGIEDGATVQYKIGTTQGNFTYSKNVTESSLAISKEKQGGLVKNGSGVYQQTYRVRLDAKDGKVTGVSLTDLPGSTKLTNLSGVTLVDTTVSSLTGEIGNSFAGLNEPLSGVEIGEGEYVILEYTMDVDPSVYAQNADGSLFSNKIKADYTTELGNPGTVQSGEVRVSVNSPTVSKKGQLNGQKVDWTITIRLNDLKGEGDLAALGAVIKDVPGLGLEGANNENDIALSEFHETSPGSGEYVCVYSTPVTDAYYESISQLNVKNDVTVTIKGNEYKASDSVKTPGDPSVLTKSPVDGSFDEETNLLKWRIEIDTEKLPDGVANFKVCDLATGVGGEITGDHTVNLAPDVRVWVDNVLVVKNGSVVDENGNPTTDAWNNPIGNGIIESSTSYHAQEILIDNDYLAAKKLNNEKIVIILQSYIRDTDRANKIYQNAVWAEYADPITGSTQSTPQVFAQWEDTNIALDVVEKEGEQISGKNSIKYTVKVNASMIPGFAAGQSIEMVDVLPDGLVYDADSFVLNDYYKKTWEYTRVQDYMYYVADVPASSGAAELYEEDGKNKLRFTIPVTEDMVKLRDYLEGMSDPAEYYLNITYTATIDDAQKFLQEGVPVAFENSVSGTRDTDSIGADSVITTMTPQSVVSKNHTYDMSTYPDVTYAVEINPQALDLSTGALTAVDKIGSALAYNLSSIKVYENVNGVWKELEHGYSYTRNIVENSITFTLPDSKWLKIEYSATVLLDADEGELNSDNAYNDFSLSGMSENVGVSESPVVSAVIKPAVGAEATKGYIKLWKYWGGLQEAQPLDGCTFAVYETNYDSATKTYSKNSIIVKDDITVGTSGEVTIYNLNRDKVYALVETAAKEGYKLNETPYYFVLPSTAEKKAEFEETNANPYMSTSPVLPFENELSDGKGMISLSKEVSGLAFDTAIDDIEFVISGENGWSKTISGSEIKIYGDTIVIADLEPGKYTIKETKKNVDGYNCVSTQYKIGVGAAVTGDTTAAFDVNQNETTSVVFTNTYEQIKGSLKLKKTVTGNDGDEPPAFTDVQQTLSFKVTGPNGETFEVDGDLLDPTTHDYVITDLAPGTYKIVETVGLVTGYSRVDTSNEVIIPGGVTPVVTDTVVADDVQVLSDEVTEVHYTNVYSEGTGSIRLKKTSSGLDFDQIKGYISFEIVPKAGGPSITVDGTKLVGEGNSFEVGGLEPGEYSVTETLTDITGYEIYKTTYSVAAGGTVEGITTPDFSVGAGDIVEVKFNNTYQQKRGSLSIGKEVSGAGLDLGDVDDTLTFIVEGPGFREEIPGTKLSEGGGNSYTINNLVPGTYTITETNTEISGYSLVKTVNVVAGESKTSSEAEVDVVGEATSEVVFRNTYEYGKGTIRLRKVTSGAKFSDIKETLEYRVTSADGYDETFTGEELVENGNSITIAGLTPGEYTIEEIRHDSNERYTYKSTVYRVNSGTEKPGTVAALELGAGDIQEVEFTNTYDLVLGQMKLTKNVVMSGSDSVTFEDVRDSLTFRITGNNYSRTFTGGDFEDDGTLTLKKLVPGTYIVTEVTTELDKLDLIRTDHVKDGTSVSGKIATVIVGPSATTTDYTEIDFNNIYSKKQGVLKITKTIKGPVTKEEAEGALRFRVTEALSGNYTDYTLDQFEYNAATKTWTLTLDKIPGGYTVKEAVSTIDGYNVTVRSSVGTDPLVGSDTVTATVNNGETAVVNFEDEYEKQKGILMLNKTVTLDGVLSKETYEAVKEKISFTITGPNGYKETIEAKDIPYDPTYNGFSLDIKDLPIGSYTITETVKGVPGYACVSTENNASLDGKRAEVTVDDYATTKTITGVTFLNDYTKVETGKLRIQKTLKGDITKEEAEGTLRFKVTNKDNEESETYTLKDFTKNADGTYTLELEMNVGGYTVEETVYDVDGYITDSVSYSVNGGERTEGFSADVSVEADETATVAFEDAYTKDEGKIVITKTIKGDVTREEAEGALQFKVTDTATGKTKTYTLKDFEYDEKTGVYTLELKKPSGSYIVEETIYDVKGYITSSVSYTVDGGEKKTGTKAMADVTAGKTVNVDFEDVYEKNAGKLVLTKTVKGDLTWDDVKDQLEFVVKNNATGDSKTYKASKFKPSAKDGVYKLVIEGLPKGEYTVTEKLDDEKGYLLETTYTVDGGSKKVGTKAKASLGEDGVQIDYVNTYTSTKGKLVLEKTLKGTIDRKDAEKVLEFEVMDVDTKKSKTYMLDDFAYDKDAKKYVLKLSLEPGTYKVTETVYDVKGYELKSVTYTVDSGEKVDGASAKVKVKTGKTITVSFVDKYYKTKTSDQTSTNTPPTSTGTSTGTPTTGRDTPKTGDEAPLALWLAMLLLGALGIGGSIYGLRRNKK